MWICGGHGLRERARGCLVGFARGYERTAELARYAAGKGVGLYLWYNSNGYWNDAPQGRVAAWTT